MEEPEAYRPLQYPDCEGQTVSPEEFSKLVDMYYDIWGWDRETGWPTRETWIRCGLEDVAEEMEKLGKLPPDRTNKN